MPAVLSLKVRVEAAPTVRMNPISRNFFPEAGPTAQTLLVFAGIAIPFVLRPFGGILLGPLGDKFGRRRVLAFTIIMMSGATFVIRGLGELPDLLGG